MTPTSTARSGGTAPHVKSYGGEHIFNGVLVEAQWLASRACITPTGSCCAPGYGSPPGQPIGIFSDKRAPEASRKFSTSAASTTSATP